MERLLYFLGYSALRVPSRGHDGGCFALAITEPAVVLVKEPHWVCTSCELEPADRAETSTSARRRITGYTASHEPMP